MSMSLSSKSVNRFTYMEEGLCRCDSVGDEERTPDYPGGVSLTTCVLKSVKVKQEVDQGDVM